MQDRQTNLLLKEVINFLKLSQKKCCKLRQVIMKKLKFSQMITVLNCVYRQTVIQRKCPKNSSNDHGKQNLISSILQKCITLSNNYTKRTVNFFKQSREKNHKFHQTVVEKISWNSIYHTSSLSVTKFANVLLNRGKKILF